MILNERAVRAGDPTAGAVRGCDARRERGVWGCKGNEKTAAKKFFSITDRIRAIAGPRSNEPRISIRCFARGFMHALWSAGLAQSSVKVSGAAGINPIHGRAIQQPE